MAKNNQLSMEELEKKGGILKGSKIACGIATILIVISCFMATFFNTHQATHMNAQDKQTLLSETNYSEVSTKEYNQKVAQLEEKIYNKEIAIKDYEKELAKIKKMTVEEFMQTYASAEEKAKYEQILQKQQAAEKNTISSVVAAGVSGIAGLGVVTALAIAADSVEDEKKKRKPNLVEGFPAPEVEA